MDTVKIIKFLIALLELILKFLANEVLHVASNQKKT